MLYINFGISPSQYTVLNSFYKFKFLIILLLLIKINFNLILSNEYFRSINNELYRKIYIQMLSSFLIINQAKIGTEIQ